MRETRLYGSEGGEAKAFPTPIPYQDNIVHNRGFKKLKCYLSLNFFRRRGKR